MNIQKRAFDLICFDLDGTLTDSIPPAIEAIQKMQKVLGLPVKTKEEINKFVGFGEMPLIVGSIGTSDPDTIKKATSTYEAIYAKESLCLIPLYPHVKEFIIKYKDKKKVIVSNKKELFIKVILENHGLLEYFTDVLGGDSTPYLKPDPGAVNDIIKKYGVKKERTLFIGDMTVDIETGKNAGVCTAAVAYGFDPRDKLAALNPDILVDDILEISRYIL
jgi:phosphoglycolate phosphatase